MPLCPWSPRVLRGLLLAVFLVGGAAQARETVTLPALDFARSLVASRNYDAAREILDLLHEADPDDIETLFLLAEIDAQSGNLEGAVERYRARIGALQHGPHATAVAPLGRGDRCEVAEARQSPMSVRRYFYQPGT